MPERRRKLLEDRWVLVSGNRRDRPSDFDYRTESAASDPCPFEPGEEERTPPEIDRIPAPEDGVPWRARAVPNKFPAVRPNQSPEATDEFPARTEPADGHQEVVVESPEHDRSLDEFDAPQARAVLTLYERRIRDLTARDDVNFLRLFRNVGARAGGSLTHPHGQLVTLPFVPSDVSRRRDTTRERYLQRNECPICRTIRRERDAGSRIVRRTEQFLVLCPYASEGPYETWIVPRKHRPQFVPLDEEARRELADLLPSVTNRLVDVLEQPAYNLVLRDDLAGGTPTPEQSEAHHWFFQFLPRITDPGGFERSTGIPINSVPPERAAEVLRKAG